MIETEHASESLAASNGSRDPPHPRSTLQQPVADSLMVSLAMIMHHVLGERVLKRGPSEEDHAIKTLGKHQKEHLKGKRQHCAHIIPLASLQAGLSCGAVRFLGHYVPNASSLVASGYK